MIDKKYLELFGENRFETFTYGEEITNEPWTLPPVALIDMDFLKQHDDLPEWESYLYKVFSSVNRIYRIDFYSKYYFHSASPTAKNIPSIHLVMAYQNYLYRLNPLLDKIEVSKNHLIEGVDEDKIYLLFIADDRRLQRDYGQFYKLLSLVNTGHALMNVELALISENIHFQTCDMPYFKRNKTPFLTISKSIKLLQDNGHKNDTHTGEHTEAQHLFETITSRTANQSTSGDVLINDTLSQAAIEELLYCLNKKMSQSGIRLSFLINDVEGYKSGYYHFKSGHLTKTSKSFNQMEPNRILVNQQAYTNLTGLNIWVFFHFHKNSNQLSFDHKFIKMGYMAQYISLLGSKWGRATRGMKNYQDRYVKERLCLTDNEFIGYSLMIFPPSYNGHSSFIKY